MNEQERRTATTTTTTTTTTTNLEDDYYSPQPHYRPYQRSNYHHHHNHHNNHNNNNHNTPSSSRSPVLIDHHRSQSNSTQSHQPINNTINHNPSPSNQSIQNHPTLRSNHLQVPFRPGFQPKGVYRNRTDDLLRIRNSKQESKRLEESRLQKRLERLIEFHTTTTTTTTKTKTKTTTTTTTTTSLTTNPTSSDPPPPSSSSSSIPNQHPSPSSILGFLKNPTTNTITPTQFAISNLINHHSPTHRQIRSNEQTIVRWQDDREVNHCNHCHTRFGLRVRKHHCRLCGSIVCFSNRSKIDGQAEERCSTLIRFEFDPPSKPVQVETSSIVKIIPLSDRQIGIPDPSSSLLHLIPPTHRTHPTHTDPNHPSSPSHHHQLDRAEPLDHRPTTGVRVCRPCLTIILRRQAMTYPPEIPDYIQLYHLLRRLQIEIERSIPEFQDLLASSQSNPNLDPSSTSSLKLLTIRKKLLNNLSLFDSNSKRLTQLISPPVGRETDRNPSEIRLITAITTRAGLFLRDHMSLIRSLGLLEPSKAHTRSPSHPTLQSKALTKPHRIIHSSSPSSLSNSSDLTQRPDLVHRPESRSDRDEHREENERLIELNVLLEQEHLIESYLVEAQSKRRLEDVASLKSSLDELRFEISNLKKILM